MKTVERTVEKDRIHLYFHLMYVKSPAIPAKNEYHSLVSPIVLRGGLFNEIHIPTIKAARVRIENTAEQIAAFLRPNKENKDAEKEADIAGTAKYMKISQLISSSVH